MSDSDLKISVVIPLYNSAAWIAETLGSVLAQTWPTQRLEVVVVDDGSTDDGAQIAQSVLEASGVEHQVIRTTNGGPSRARNIGFRAARHAWIQFLDSDDLIAEEKLQVQGAVAARSSEQVAVIYSPWRRLQDPSHLAFAKIDDALTDLIGPDNFIATGSQLFRRTWLESTGGFDERYRLIEDVHLMLRIAMAGGTFVAVPHARPLFFYRMRVGQSLSQSDEAAFYEGCLRNARMVEDYSRAHGDLTPGRLHNLALVHFYACRCFAERDAARFDELAAHLLTLEPGFIPPHPPALAALSRLVGYRRAEPLSVLYRQLKRVFWSRR